MTHGCTHGSPRVVCPPPISGVSVAPRDPTPPNERESRAFHICSQCVLASSLVERTPLFAESFSANVSNFHIPAIQKRGCQVECAQSQQTSSGHLGCYRFHRTNLGAPCLPCSESEQPSRACMDLQPLLTRSPERLVTNEARRSSKPALRAHILRHIALCNHPRPRRRLKPPSLYFGQSADYFGKINAISAHDRCVCIPPHLLSSKFVALRGLSSRSHNARL